MGLLATLICLTVFVSAGTVVGTGTSEGTEFAFALPPVYEYYTYYHAEVIVNSRLTTDVTITTGFSSDTVTVYENYSLHYDMDTYMRTTDGIEEKGVLVTSRDHVNIHVATYSSGGYNPYTPDACIVRPVHDTSVEFFLAGYHGMRSDSGWQPMSFYMVVATEENTEIVVHYREGISLEDEHFTLNQYEVFTRDVYYIDGRPKLDFTGTRVLATKPVSVYAGNGLVWLYAPGAHTSHRYLFESMPTMDDLGTVYTSFPIHYGGDGGYEVRVIAVADDTDVSIPDFSTDFTLDMGEFYVVDNTVTKFGFVVTCSKPCMTVQYVRSLPAGGDTGLAMSAFLAVLIPDERAANNLIFTVPRMIDYSSSYTGAISIIVNTFPVTGLHLNDTSLADLDWEAVHFSSNWFATLEVEYGFYQLYSSEPSERFTAYLYVFSGSTRPAVGFPVGYGEAGVEPTDPPPTLPTTTMPPVGETPPAPRYQIALLGNFTSVNDEDFTMECTQALEENFRQKTAQMVPGLNSMLGKDMCDYVSVGDVHIVFLSILLLTHGSVGTSTLEYVLEADIHVSISNLSSCAGELSVYLQDFDNWQEPIIPPEPGCPLPVFEPEYFVDGSTGNDWVCINANKDEELRLQTVDAPWYSLSIFDNFTTIDDDDLSVGCADAYRVEWRAQVESMVVTLNDQLSTGELCLDQHGQLNVIAAAASLVSQGSKGTLNANFLMALTTDHQLFDDVHSCVNEMFLFLVYHINWGTLPLLPQQPGCPALTFAPPVFYHNGENWQCP